MKKLSQPERVIEFLKRHANQKFTARHIAEAIVEEYEEYYVEKRANFNNNERAFIQQIVAEIGANKESLFKHCPQIRTQDRPRPRLYWYDSTASIAPDVATENVSEEILEYLPENQWLDSEPKRFEHKISEHDLYPKLMEYLSQELGLYSLRIDEKRSSNNKGARGNHWLYPDIVAMQAVDKDWQEDVKKCANTGQRVILYSFEVKIALNGGNVRESFFQAVSNSSWANEGYLVATQIMNDHSTEELRTLSALHGIGVIILNLDNINESEIWLPAKRKEQIDWQSVNRIVEQNRDFEKFVSYVATYYQTGKIFEDNWNK